MKKVDRLIIQEMVGPWLFGVMMFTVLIMAGEFLFELTRLLAEGTNPGTVVHLGALLMPGVLAKTFSMAMLLATLLAFGFLSGNSEIVALRAAGTSVLRMMAPVGAAGALVAVGTFFFNDVLVPRFSRQAIEIRQEIGRHRGKAQSTSQTLTDKDGKVVGFLSAQDFRIADRSLIGADILYYDKDGNTTSLLHADKLEYTDLKHWRIDGKANFFALGPRPAKTDEADSSSVIYNIPLNGHMELVDGAWPEGVTEPAITPEDLVTRALRDLDARSMDELARDIARLRQEPHPDWVQIANLEFGYWNKVTVPLAALVFGLLGAPLGIRSHRTSVATGFWMSIVLIFGYMLITNAMSILAEGGRIPSVAASFTPVVAGLVAAAYFIQRRNVQ